MSDRLLIRGGYVLTMDRNIGELAAGDVLIEDEQIAPIAPDIEAGDARGDRRRAATSSCPASSTPIGTPGRPRCAAICADWTLSDYFRGMRQTISPRYPAEDVYAATTSGRSRRSTPA